MANATPIQKLEQYFATDKAPKDVARHLRVCFTQLSLVLVKYSPESGKITYIDDVEDALYTLHELSQKLDPDCC